MKKIILVLILSLVAVGFSMAGGLDFQLGAGYHSSYYSTEIGAPDDITALPLGVGGYVGVGYGFGDSQFLNLGIEFAPSWDLSISPWGVSNFNYQARGYVKVKPLEMLTVTGFGGYAGNAFLGYDWKEYQENASWSVGARLTFLFLYAEYSAILNSSYDGITKSEIGVGVKIFN